MVVISEGSQDVGTGQHLPLTETENQGGTSVTEIGNDGKLGELSKGQETPEFFETEGNRGILDKYVDQAAAICVETNL